MKCIACIITFLVLLSTNIFSEEIMLHMKIIKVSDGDTLVGRYYNLPVKIRLANIDAFEITTNSRILKQITATHLLANTILELGKQAKEVATDYVSKNDNYVCIKCNTKKLLDKYGRYLGVVYSNYNCEGKSLNDILLEKNLAIPY